MYQNPQESNPDQDAYYREYFFNWPGLFHIYEQHPGFKGWFREMEIGVGRGGVRYGPDFKTWVDAQIIKEYPFINEQ